MAGPDQTFDEPLGNQRAFFDLPADVAYFNCASLSPLMRHAREAGEAALLRRAQPWRIATADWFEGAERRRALFAELIGAEPDGVALVPATSYGLAAAARNLTAGPGQRVLVLAQDYPSGISTGRAFAARTACSPS